VGRPLPSPGLRHLDTGYWNRIENLMSSLPVTARPILSRVTGVWILMVQERVLLTGSLDDCVAALLAIEARAGRTARRCRRDRTAASPLAPRPDTPGPRLAPGTLFDQADTMAGRRPWDIGPGAGDSEGRGAHEDPGDRRAPGVS